MKVCYIYRERRETGFSIEEVFDTVRKELPDHLEQLAYYIDKSKSVLQNIKAIRQTHADIYHITGDCNYVAIGLPRKKTVLTVHDIGAIDQGLKGWKRVPYILIWWLLPLFWVRQVTAISNFTKTRLKSRFNWLVKNIHVIYNPLPNGYYKSLKEVYNIVPVLLQIGGGHNKNIEGLIHLANKRKCNLVVVRPLDPKLEKTFIEHGISYKWYSNLSKTELVELYKQCDMVYFASTYEGFGLPIIEAQAIGRPILTSKCCSMPEIYGNEAYLANPDKFETIITQFDALMKPEIRESEIKRGFQNCQRFEAQNISSQYLMYYKKVLRQS